MSFLSYVLSNHYTQTCTVKTTFSNTLDHETVRIYVISLGKCYLLPGFTVAISATLLGNV